jgi:hypothetical protein
VLDFVNIMTYDFAGSWQSQTGHHTSLRDTKHAVNLFLGGGMPADKIVIGGAFYGRQWNTHSLENNGLYQSGTPMSEEWTFDQICGELQQGSLATYRDEEAEAAYAFCRNRRLFVTYDNEWSLERKCQYVHQHQLGGIMVWYLAQNADNRLANMLADCLGSQSDIPGSTQPKKMPARMPENQRPTEQEFVPPPVSPLIVGGAPREGAPCNPAQIDMCAGGPRYMQCVHDRWMMRSCAPGTVCRQQSSGIACDFA